MQFSITKPATATEGFSAILYGAPGTGKTSTLDDPNFQVLMIDLEGGSAVLSEAENVHRIDVPTEAKNANVLPYEMMEMIGKELSTGELANHYDLIAIDSLTRFEDYVKEYVAKKYAPNRKREIQSKFGAMADWGDLKDLTLRMVKAFHSLTKRGEKSVHVLWIAHEADKKENLAGTDKEIIVGKKIQFQGGNTSDVIMSIVDGFFYMYNKTVQDDNGSHIERGIITAHDFYASKARVSKKRDPLPSKIVSPVWSEIFEALGYTRK